MTRRDMLKTLGTATGLAAVAPLAGSLRAAAERGPYSADALGIITETVRAELARDPRGTLRALRALGYRYLEGGPPEGVATAEFAGMVREAGLECIATGTSMAEWLRDADHVLREVTTLGARYGVCYWPWTSSAEALTLQEVQEAAGRLNTLGERLRREGVRFVWHNHDKEFGSVDGEVVVDRILRETDPELVGVELDWYWVIKAGADTVSLFQRFPGRFDLAHVKDMNNHEDRGITCVGSGTIDFDRILRHAADGGTRYLIVEHERALDGLRCAQLSIRHLAVLLR